MIASRLNDTGLAGQIGMKVDLGRDYAYDSDAKQQDNFMRFARLNLSEEQLLQMLFQNRQALNVVYRGLFQKPLAKITAALRFAGMATQEQVAEAAYIEALVSCSDERLATDRMTQVSRVIRNAGERGFFTERLFTEFAYKMDFTHERMVSQMMDYGVKVGFKCYVELARLIVERRLYQTGGTMKPEIIIRLYHWARETGEHIATDTTAYLHAQALMAIQGTERGTPTQPLRNLLENGRQDTPLNRI